MTAVFQRMNNARGIKNTKNTFSKKHITLPWVKKSKLKKKRKIHLMIRKKSRLVPQIRKFKRLYRSKYKKQRWKKYKFRALVRRLLAGKPKQIKILTHKDEVREIDRRLEEAEELLTVKEGSKAFLNLVIISKKRINYHVYPTNEELEDLTEVLDYNFQTLKAFYPLTGGWLPFSMFVQLSKEVGPDTPLSKNPPRYYRSRYAGPGTRNTRKLYTKEQRQPTPTIGKRKHFWVRLGGKKELLAYLYSNNLTKGKRHLWRVVSKKARNIEVKLQRLNQNNPEEVTMTAEEVEEQRLNQNNPEEATMTAEEVEEQRLNQNNPEEVTMTAEEVEEQRLNQNNPEEVTMTAEEVEYRKKKFNKFIRKHKHGDEFFIRRKIPQFMRPVKSNKTAIKIQPIGISWKSKKTVSKELISITNLGVRNPIEKYKPRKRRIWPNVISKKKKIPSIAHKHIAVLKTRPTTTLNTLLRSVTGVSRPTIDTSIRLRRRLLDKDRYIGDYYYKQFIKMNTNLPYAILDDYGILQHLAPKTIPKWLDYDVDTFKAYTLPKRVERRFNRWETSGRKWKRNRRKRRMNRLRYAYSFWNVRYTWRPFTRKIKAKLDRGRFRLNYLKFRKQTKRLVKATKFKSKQRFRKLSERVINTTNVSLHLHKFKRIFQIKNYLPNENNWNILKLSLAATINKDFRNTLLNLSFKQLKLRQKGYRINSLLLKTAKSKTRRLVNQKKGLLTKLKELHEAQVEKNRLDDIAKQKEKEEKEDDLLAEQAADYADIKAHEASAKAMLEGAELREASEIGDEVFDREILSEYRRLQAEEKTRKEKEERDEIEGWKNKKKEIMHNLNVLKDKKQQLSVRTAQTPRINKLYNKIKTKDRLERGWSSVWLGPTLNRPLTYGKRLPRRFWSKKRKELKLDAYREAEYARIGKEAYEEALTAIPSEWIFLRRQDINDTVYHPKFHKEALDYGYVSLKKHSISFKKRLDAQKKQIKVLKKYTKRRVFNKKKFTKTHSWVSVSKIYKSNKKVVGLGTGRSEYSGVNTKPLLLGHMFNDEISASIDFLLMETMRSINSRPYNKRYIDFLTTNEHVAYNLIQIYKLDNGPGITEVDSGTRRLATIESTFIKTFEASTRYYNKNMYNRGMAFQTPTNLSVNNMYHPEIVTSRKIISFGDSTNTNVRVRILKSKNRIIRTLNFLEGVLTSYDRLPNPNNRYEGKNFHRLTNKIQVFFKLVASKYSIRHESDLTVNKGKLKRQIKTWGMSPNLKIRPIDNYFKRGGWNEQNLNHYLTKYSPKDLYYRSIRKPHNATPQNTNWTGWSTHQTRIMDYSKNVKIKNKKYKKKYNPSKAHLRLRVKKRANKRNLKRYKIPLHRRIINKTNTKTVYYMTKRPSIKIGNSVIPQNDSRLGNGTRYRIKSLLGLPKGQNLFIVKKQRTLLFRKVTPYAQYRKRIVKQIKHLVQKLTWGKENIFKSEKNTINMKTTDHFIKYAQTYTNEGGFENKKQKTKLMDRPVKTITTPQKTKPTTCVKKTNDRDRLHTVISDIFKVKKIIKFFSHKLSGYAQQNNERVLAKRLGMLAAPTKPSLYVSQPHTNTIKKAVVGGCTTHYSINTLKLKNLILVKLLKFLNIKKYKKQMRVRKLKKLTRRLKRKRIRRLAVRFYKNFQHGRALKKKKKLKRRVKKWTKHTGMKIIRKKQKKPKLKNSDKIKYQNKLMALGLRNTSWTLNTSGNLSGPTKRLILHINKIFKFEKASRVKIGLRNLNKSHLMIAVSYLFMYLDVNTFTDYINNIFSRKPYYRQKKIFYVMRRVLRYVGRKARNTLPIIGIYTQFKGKLTAKGGLRKRIFRVKSGKYSSANFSYIFKYRFKQLWSKTGATGLKLILLYNPKWKT